LSKRRISEKKKTEKIFQNLKSVELNQSENNDKKPSKQRKKWVDYLNEV